MSEITSYPITLGYGDTSFPYSSRNPHRGVDYVASEGTPLLVAETEIGTFGATGLAYGPHCHVQCGKDEWAQQTIDPTPYVNQPGIVERTGTASQFGKFVVVRVGDVNVFYCHLNWINVITGDLIGTGGNVKKIIGAPASNSWGKGRIDTVVRTDGDELWHLWYDDATGWGVWNQIGGGIASSPSITSKDKEQLDVFATGISGDLIHFFYRDGKWSLPETKGSPN